MPKTSAGKAADKGVRGTRGPGSAADRAMHKGTRGTSGRVTAAEKAKKSTPQKMAPNS